MLGRPMRWPLRNQVFLPFAALLTASVFGVALVSAWYAAEQAERQKLQHLRSIAAALGDANFPLTAPVVDRIAGMVGGQVVVLDARGKLKNATIERADRLVTQLLDPSPLDGPVTVSWNATTYLVTAVERRAAVGGGTLLVLIPQTQFTTSFWQNITLPLMAAAMTLVMALLIAMLVAGRLGRRLQRLPNLFNELAEGRFQQMEVDGRDDETRDLLLSANLLSERLETMQRDLRLAERLQLLGQLSGGLAHQLRNSITGARMGIELHRRYCDHDQDRMLDTALAQLRLTEEQVRAVLSLKPEPDVDQGGQRETTDLVALLREIERLLTPQCEHWKTDFRIEPAADSFPIRLQAVSAVKGALLNLTLNAIEAAGVSGTVVVEIQTADRTEGHDSKMPGRSDAVTITIRDSGPGFPDHLKPAAIEVFQTTKQDGIGLGLTIAQHAINGEGGRLMIDREPGWTVVSVLLPVPDMSHQESHS